jgi:hypothetical protein
MQLRHFAMTVGSEKRDATFTHPQLRVYGAKASAAPEGVIAKDTQPLFRFGNGCWGQANFRASIKSKDSGVEGTFNISFITCTALRKADAAPPSCMEVALYQSRLRPHASSTKRVLQCQMDSLPLEEDALGVPSQAASSVPTGCVEHSSLDP